MFYGVDVIINIYTMLFEWMNEKASILGYTQEEIAVLSIRDLAVFNYSDLLGIITGLAQGKKIGDRKTFIKKDGTKTKVIGDVYPFKYNGEQYIVICNAREDIEGTHIK
jgi:hypothetical protein